MEKLFSDIFCQIFGCSDCGQISTCIFLKFALISMFFGLLCITADFIVYKLTKKPSFLKVRYIDGVLFVFLFWSLGSLVIGYIGAAAQLFDTTKIFSALFVGVSWQFIFARWVAGKFDKEDSQPINAN